MTNLQVRLLATPIALLAGAHATSQRQAHGERRHRHYSYKRRDVRG